MARGPVGAGDGQTEVWDVKLKWVFNGSQMQTGFSLRKGAALLATEQDMANNVDTALRPTFRTLLATTATYLGVDVVNVVTREGASVSPTGVVGTVSNVGLGPAFITAVLSLKGELRTRYGQGRMLLPVVSESFYDIETLSPGALAIINPFITALADTYIGAESGQEFVMVNHHGPLAAGRNAPRVPALAAVPATYYDVTSARLNTAVSFLRSRKAGVGS